MYLINNATALRSISLCATTRSPLRAWYTLTLQPDCCSGEAAVTASAGYACLACLRSSQGIRGEITAHPGFIWSYHFWVTSSDTGSAAVQGHHGLNTDRMKERRMKGKGGGDGEGGELEQREEWERPGSVTWAGQGGREDREISWKYLHTHSGRGFRITEENIKMHI